MARRDEGLCDGVPEAGRRHASRVVRITCITGLAHQGPSLGTSVRPPAAVTGRQARLRPPPSRREAGGRQPRVHPPLPAASNLKPNRLACLPQPQHTGPSPRPQAKHIHPSITRPSNIPPPPPPSPPRPPCPSRRPCSQLPPLRSLAASVANGLLAAPAVSSTHPRLLPPRLLLPSAPPTLPRCLPSRPPPAAPPQPQPTPCHHPHPHQLQHQHQQR